MKNRFNCRKIGVRLKRILFVLICIVLVANIGVAAPNYSFTSSSNNIKSNQLPANFNVYNPENYIKNQVVNNLQYDIVEIVIDYSSSMRPWIDKAKNTMQQILPQIPSTTHVGLRVFGNKVNEHLLNSNNLFKNVAYNIGGVVGDLTSSCRSTSQIVGISPVNSAALISAMNNTSIGTSTPLTLALEQTIYYDFANKNSLNKKKIILITDGLESCGRNPCEFIRNLVKTRADIQIDVIVINGSNKLKCLTEATGGTFYHVTSAYNFNSALECSLSAPASSDAQNYRPQPQNTNHYKFLAE